MGCRKLIRTNELKRLVKHVQECMKLKSELREVIDCDFSDALEKSGTDNNYEANEMFTEILIENNIAFRCLESVTFKRWINRFAPGVRLNSRDVISDKFLSKLSLIEARKSQAKSIEQRMQASAEFDHWKDSNQSNLLAIVITFRDGGRYLFGICDVSLKSQTWDAIEEVLKQSLAASAIYLNSMVYRI